MVSKQSFVSIILVSICNIWLVMPAPPHFPDGQVIHISPLMDDDGHQVATITTGINDDDGVQPSINSYHQVPAKQQLFSISILQSIDVSARDPQALILSPTREPATQIKSVVLAPSDYMNIQCHTSHHRRRQRHHWQQKMY